MQVRIIICEKIFLENGGGFLDIFFKRGYNKSKFLNVHRDADKIET